MPLFLILFIFLANNVFCCDFSEFDRYQYRLSFEEVSFKIAAYLEKDPDSQHFYKLTSNALYIGDWENCQLDYVLHFAKASEPRQPSIMYKSLHGLKVAIDPGHFGGIFAKLEERYIEIPAEKTKNGHAIYFCEGDLTYMTALALKRLLEAEGALVLLTRTGIGQGAIAEDFFSWLEQRPHLKDSVFSLSELFRGYYNSEDLRKRANKINDFSPDITVVVHYNAHLTDKEKKAKSSFTQCNYNLAFIPGAFGFKELQDERDRYEFLRLLVTDNIEESLRLSRCIVNQFVTQLKVPLIAREEKTSYTDKVCIRQESGIYCRNLALTRLVHSPICYGETLVQNNEEEAYRLSTCDTMIDGIPCPKRVEEVAKAYFEGIKQYFINDLV